MLPSNWRRLSDRNLALLEKALRLKAESLDDADDALIDQLDAEIDLIEDEKFLRRHPDPADVIDMDEQDRRAASEERIENHRRER